MSFSALLTELQKLSDSTDVLEDGDERRQLADALQKASMKIETPIEFVRRISFTPLQIVVAKIGIDLGIFEMLDEVESSSLEQLVHKTGSERALLVRLLRFLASTGMISQHTSTTYGPTAITHSLSKGGLRAGILHHFDVQIPVWLALPSFLASTSYSSPRSSTETAFQRAHSTPLQAFAWASERPQIMADFALWMSAQRVKEQSWLNVFTQEEIVGITGDIERSCQDGQTTPLFVDIGGGMGHQCYALRAWLPLSVSTNMEIILQDLPGVVSLANVEAKGIRALAHDMFTPQPVKGAKFYYLRNVLHDHPDLACVAILDNIRSAMDDQSIILIDEMVLPEKMESGDRVGQWATSLDIAVMASLGAQERTKLDWEQLLSLAGMRLEDMRKYDHEGNSVLVVKQKLK